MRTLPGSTSNASSPGVPNRCCGSSFWIVAVALLVASPALLGAERFGEGLIGLVRAIGVDHHGDRLGSLAGIEDERSTDRREVAARDRRAAVSGRVIEPHVRNARVVERDREGDGGGAACALGLAHVADRNRRQVADIGDVCAGKRRECERGIEQDRRPAREIEDAGPARRRLSPRDGSGPASDIDAPGVGGRIEGEETRKVVAGWSRTLT